MRQKIILWIGALLLFAFSASVFNACKSKENHQGHEDHEEKASQNQGKKMYHCPMHPTYTSDKPGDCPICGMKLVSIEEAEHTASVDGHPESAEDREDERKNGHGVEGQAPVQISAEREQLIGVKTGEVTRRRLRKMIRASARVAYDTELYNAITEYKSSVEAFEKIKQSPSVDAREGADSLVRSSRLRLRQLGLSDDQITNIDKTYPNPANLLLSEKGGTVWIYAQIYEYESGLIRSGQKLEVSSPAFPGKKFNGTVKAVDSILDSQSRSLKMRAEVNNPEGLLKPEMYVNARIDVDFGERLAVPEEAVLNTGERQIVFIVKENGRYDPRTVELGQEAERYYEVISGLSEGERVVTSANFLIDSESKLKSAVSGSTHQH